MGFLDLLIDITVLAILILGVAQLPSVRPRSSKRQVTEISKALSGKVAYLIYLRLETGSDDPLADFMYLQEILQREGINLEDYGVPKSHLEALSREIFEDLAMEDLEQIQQHRNPSILQDIVDQISQQDLRQPRQRQEDENYNDW